MGNESSVAQQTEGIGKEFELYTSRFNREETKAREITWKVLVADFLQQYIHAGDTVVDIGAGDGLFLCNVKAARRVAIDLSAHVGELEKFGVEILQVPATDLRQYFRGTADVVFMSNFLEHLPDKRVLLRVLEECYAVLRPGGTIMILQPNIRYVGAAYWDYIDHHIALTEHSLTEALEVSGFKVTRLIPKFLPYTAKSVFGRLLTKVGGEAAIRYYLRFPLLWKIFGQQTFVVATRWR